MDRANVSTSSVRLRYSRDEVLALKERASSLDFPIHPVPLKPSRQNRKKSQSSETDANLVSENGYTSVDGQGGLRRIRPWHPNAGRCQSHYNNHQSSGSQLSHQKQRCPSGPHGDASEVDSSATFRPVSTEHRRGAQGDWSKGCAGWRQRSYSGSEDFGVLVGNHPRARGVGLDCIADKEYTIHRGRGIGRCAALHRGSALRGSFTSSCRPVSFVHTENATDNGDTEVQLEDKRKSLDLESEPVGRENQNRSQGHPTSKPSTDASVIPSPDLDTSVTKNVIKSSANLRVYSQSCSIDPPPGFELSSKVDTSHQFPAAVSDGSKEDAARHQADTSWYYIDSAGQTQGPFGDEQMAAWLAKGYLPLHVEVRRHCDECFLPLLNHLTLAGRIPFWKGYSQTPITRSNLASVLASSGSPLSSPLWLNQSPPHINAAGGMGYTTDVSVQKPVLLAKPEQHVDSPLMEVSDVTKPVQQSSPIEQLPDSSSTSLASNNEILRLCTEAQALAMHAAKVEAERQELAEKLTAISSTAAKLLAAPSNQSLTSFPVFSTANSVLSTECPSLGPNEPPEKHAPNSLEVGVPDKCSDLESVNKKEFCQINENSESLPICVQEISTSSQHECDKPHPEAPEAKKGKKKHKKNKKGKLTQEQERQLAWEAEFQRRKAAALEKQVAEEDARRRFIEEESAAVAEEQAAIKKEQRRLLKEHRKQELLKAKAESELAQLKLPESVRWATSADSSGRRAPVGLADIQAAQALEEAESNAMERSAAQQTTALVEAESRAFATPRPNAWASVVGADSRVSSKSEIRTSRQTASPKVEQSVSIAPKAEQTRAPTDRATAVSHCQNSSISSKSHPKNQSTSAVSIWDLPNTDITNTVQSKRKSSKKNKKQNAVARANEVKLFAAKEQLAHWCESQLSSMPLSGFDLPTVVDLLCELETADQVVEFIETSLGRSKLTSNFSKAFLEKRAGILNAVL